MLFRSDRKSTRLNSSHTLISYAVFCLKKKKQQHSSGHARWAGEYVRTAERPSTRPRTPAVDRAAPLVPMPVRLHAPFLLFFFKEPAPPGIFLLSPPPPFPI